MYETGEGALKRILELVGQCPKEHQAKCFEILLDGYVEAEVQHLIPAGGGKVKKQETDSQKPSQEGGSQIPAAVLPRFKATAKRLGLPLERLESLFDFNVDPFALHALSVPGTKTAEKSRNVVLLVAARSYLATGAWTADWQEVKAQCVDQNCYDTVNHASNLKKGAPSLFKPVEAGGAIELSSGGVKAAEALLKKLGGAGGNDAQQ